MPVPAKAPVPPPPAPGVLTASLAAGGRQPDVVTSGSATQRGSVPGMADVTRTQSALGNAAATAVGGPGALPGPPVLAGRMLLAGQGLGGNAAGAAVASRGVAAHAEDMNAAQPKEFDKAPAPDAKTVVPLKPDQPPGRPAAPDPDQAAPDQLPPSATDMSAGPAQVNRQMAGAQVTEAQLAHSNETTFKA